MEPISEMNLYDIQEELEQRQGYRMETVERNGETWYELWHRNNKLAQSRNQNYLSRVAWREIVPRWTEERGVALVLCLMLTSRRGWHLGLHVPYPSVTVAYFTNGTTVIDPPGLMAGHIDHDRDPLVAALCRLALATLRQD